MKAVLAELEFESQSTIRILDRVPTDKLEWTPHPKSMSLGRLAWHIAMIPATSASLLRAGTFDLAAARPPKPPDGGTPVDSYRHNLEEIVALLGSLDDDAARRPFTLRRGEQLLREMPAAMMVRTILLNHSYHHRGQLSVYLRLLDVPVPALYGTSADENPFA